MNETELAFDFGEPSGRHSKVINIEVDFRGDKKEETAESLERREAEPGFKGSFLKAELIAAEAKQRILSALETDHVFASQALISVLSQILSGHIIVSMNFHPLPLMHRGDSSRFRSKTIQLAEGILMEEVRQWHEDELKSLLNF